EVVTTDVEGMGKIQLAGNEGDIFDIAVACPEGFRSPAKPVHVVLHRLAEADKTPEYAVSCPPTTRTVVVAVRADNGANLPVRYLGREVARTDSSGVAHFVGKFRADEEF